jgi:hypothetical protein
MIQAKLGRHPGFDFAVGKSKDSFRESLTACHGFAMMRASPG